MFHSTFTTIQPHYHQVCSSDLISPDWIQYTMLSLLGAYSAMDYRINAGPQFKLLATLCKQASQTINDARRDFLQTKFVGSRVIPQQLFESQVYSLIQNWQSITINQFLRTIQLVRATTQGNQLANGNSNVGFHVNITSRQTEMVPVMYSNCSCALFKSCRLAMAIYNYEFFDGDNTVLYSIPNFFVGCFPMEALLASTLECFYNRSCVIEIDKYMFFSYQKISNFSALNASRNLPTATIESIVNHMMVDWWSKNVSFTAYYNECAPISCTFEYRRRNDLFFIITTIIGVFGGLSFGFKILILFVLRLIEKIMNGFSRHGLMHSIRNVFIYRDEHKMVSQLHFVLVTATLCVFYIFSAFTPQLITDEIQKPLLSNYHDLAIRFPDSLQCPCSQISIKYQSFLDIEPQLHQICSSDFVSDRWIAYLYDEGFLVDRFGPTDFLYSATGQFQLLASLCNVSQEVVNGALLQLNTSNFISTQLLSPSLLDKRIRTIVKEFQMTMPNLFLSALSLIRETTGANMIISGWSTSWVVDTPPEIKYISTAHTMPLIYEGCNCGLSSKCVQPSRGMLAGCYPLEALFQSTLHCLYDQQCIDPSHMFKAMNISSSKSHFDINATIESIVNQLLIEDYSRSMSYEKYFDQCAPSSCSYSYFDKSNIIQGLIKLIALYGGLVIICRWVAVIIVMLFRRQTRTVSPATD